jgi:Xaa-Pro dipeptidase
LPAISLGFDQVSSSEGQARGLCVPEMDIPFLLPEFQTRLRAVKALMEQSRVDLLFLSAPESLYYVSGYRAQWYQAQSPAIWPPASGIAIRRDADDFIHFETEMEETLVKSCAISRDIRIYREDEASVLEFIVANLKDAGWLKGTVGLEKWSYRPSPGYSELFQAGLENHGVSVVDATSILRDVRRIKSPQELSYIREASRIADIGMTAAKRALTTPGVTELDVYSELTYAMGKAGGEPAAIPLAVLSGERSATPHALTSRHQIKPGDIVSIDVCGVYNRYHSNVARTFSVGAPAPGIEEYIAKTAYVFSVLDHILRPDIRVAEVLSAVKQYFEDIGIWEDHWWIGGYELGLAFAPDWDGHFTYDIGTDPGDDIFEPGMVINFESNFYLPKGIGCSGIINTMEISQTDVTWLSSLPLGLMVVD